MNFFYFTFYSVALIMIIYHSKKSNNLKFIIRYKSKNLPKNTVEIENISVAIIYVQK